MPLISTFGSAGAQSFGNKGLILDGSAEFNALGDRFSFPLSTAFNYGTGSFTIEMWIYPTAFGAPRVIWTQAPTIYLYMYNTGALLWYPGSGNAAITTNSMTLNAWNHVAIVRISNSMRIFLNGVGYASVANSANILTPTSSPLLGAYDASGNYQFLGYISNFRISKQALYTANFTPSLISFTRTSQGSSTTNLLMNMRNSSTLSVDSSGNNLSITNFNVTHSPLSPYRVPYIVPPAVVVVSALVDTSTTAPREGDTITVFVNGSNTSNGTYYYTLQEDLATGALTTADFTSGSLSGSFTINGNSGSFPITVTADLLTEGNETFTIYVRQNSTSGTIIGTSAEITITDSSLTPAFRTFSPSIAEGLGGGYAVENVGPDGTYFWTILHNTSVAADFTATSGSFTVAGSTGGLDNGFSQTDASGISVRPSEDRTTEGSETFRLQIRSGSTSGPVILTSDLITITDRSLTPEFVTIPTSVDEGTSANITVRNLGPAGTYYWTISPTTSVENDFVSVSGSFNVLTLNGEASFSIPITADRTTEGAETFQVVIRTGPGNSPVIMTSPIVTINDTSIPATLTADSTQIRESTVQTSSIPSTVNFTATNLGPAGTYYWTLNQPTFPLSNYGRAADFTGGVTGSFQTTTLNQSVVIPISASAVDVIEEPTLPFSFSIRTGGDNGPIIITSSNLSFLDCTIVVTITNGGFGTTQVNEGQQYDLTFKTGPGTPASSYYWEVVNVTTTNADFVTLAGTVNLQGLGTTTTAPATFRTASLDGAEGGEQFQIRVRHLNASGEIYGLGGNFTIQSNAT